MNADLLICIPTYDERENVGPISKQVFEKMGERAHILFIDDNSPDGTGKLCDEMAENDPRIHVLHRAGKQGLATAYIQGFQWGLARNYKWFVEMDADFSHDAKHLVEFCELIDSGEVDAVVGSRYVAGGGVSNWSRWRLLLSRGGSIYSTLWLSYGIKDWTGGFNAWSRQTLEDICLESIRSKGYAFQIELKYRCKVLHKRLVESPIVFQERRAGQSKMSGSIVKEAVLAVALLRFRETVGTLFRTEEEQKQLRG